MPTRIHYLRRPARWLRRTHYMLTRTRADLGLGGPTPPVWLRGNPFLLKAGRTETRRLGLLLRLGLTVLLLAGLLLGGLWLERTYARALTGVLGFVFGMTFPAALFVVLTFVHTALISSARTAQAVSLADEARRGTLADLLLTPLPRAEMLLAMGVAPARTAFLVALAGLPVYVLLGEIGALSARDIVFLYLLFALVCYAPPTYALPALAGGAMTPDTALGRFGLSRARRPARPNAYTGAGLSVLFSVFFLGQTLGLLRGGWLGHLLGALHLHFSPGFSFFVFFAWPVYAAQVLGDRPDFFHLSVSPLLYGLPLLLCAWAASALHSAAALSAGDADEMGRLPVASRARTLSRWTARAAGLCALGVVWRAWVESGDAATLAGGSYGAPGWDAAGLLLGLGALSLPTVCRRALESSSATPGGRPGHPPRPVWLVLRRALKRSARPLGVAGAAFLIACALGGLSPFAPPVYSIAGRLALAGLVSVVWAVGLRHVLPAKRPVSVTGLLYAVPVAALSLPVRGAAWLAVLSPATAWLRLFPDAPGLVSRFPLWHIAAPPPWEACLAGPVLAGVLGMAAGAVGLRGMLAGQAVERSLAPDSGGTGKNPERIQPSPTPAPPPSTVGGAGGSSSPRHAARTAALMAWVTARTDNPLFTHELRTRTRSGRWADWLTLAPLVLLAGLILTAAYPDAVTALAFVSPFHFFSGFRYSTNPVAPVAGARADLASLLLAGQCWLLGFRGQVIGEGLIARDRQRGIWGFILLTPLPAGAVFRGRALGQTAGMAAIWAVCGAVSLLLYGLAAPAVGLLPALAAWASGQALVGALFVLGVAVGAALSTYPVFSKSLRGAAGLLFVLVVGLGLWGQFQFLPLDMPGGGPNEVWWLLVERLGLGIGYALALAVPLLAFAQWRVADLRRRDIAVGDGAE